MSSKNQRVVGWDSRFTPSYSPQQMLKMGIFEGKYINNIKNIPKSWKQLDRVVDRNQPPDPSLNYFGVKSRLSLGEWQSRGWINSDANGWFHWYICYWFGRRLGEEDDWQIKRWINFVIRHQAQISHYCRMDDLSCRVKQRQALLQWAWDSTTPFSDEQRQKNIKQLRQKMPRSITLEVVGEPKWIDW